MPTLYNASVTATLYICRTVQVIKKTAAIATSFLPTVINATKTISAYLVIAGCWSIESGLATRNFIERLGLGLAGFLNEITYTLHPHLAPAAQPVEYFIDIPLSEPVVVVASKEIPAITEVLTPLPIPETLTFKELAKIAKDRGIQVYRTGQNRRKNKQELLAELA